MKTIVAFFASGTSAWVIGTQQTETHPKLTWQRCTGKGGTSCSNVNGEIVIDANWRWYIRADDSYKNALTTLRLHDKTANSYTNCFDGNTWNKSLCPSNTACTANCAIEGSDYSGTYGITTSGNQLNLKFVTKGQYSTNIGSRTYLMQDTNNYQMFNLIGNEFSFDVDLSQLPCGLNGALYFVSMPQKGQGTPGAKYGTGESHGFFKTSRVS